MVGNEYINSIPEELLAQADAADFPLFDDATLNLYYRDIFLAATQKRNLVRNMIAVAYLVIKQGREIKESVGCHYNADYPNKEKEV